MATIEHGSASVPALSQYLRCAENNEVDIDKILKAHQFDKNFLKNNTDRIDGTLFQNILESLIKASKNPLFGLETAQYVQPITYSIYGYMAMNSRNLGEALDRIPEYEKLVGDMGVTKIIYKNEHVFVRWDCAMSKKIVRRHVIENVMASWTVFSQWITGINDVYPLEIHFEHSPPAKRELLTKYDEIFNCPVLFNCDKTGILIPQDILDYPLIQADETVFASLQDTANQRLTQLSGTSLVTSQVKSALRSLMKEKIPRKDALAEMIGMTNRTMQRRLKEEGSSYQEILNELRHETAIDLLENSNLSLEEIGHRLGFQEPRSFHRSFKVWTGQTPGLYRKNV